MAYSASSRIATSLHWRVAVGATTVGAAVGAPTLVSRLCRAVYTVPSMACMACMPWRAWRVWRGVYAVHGVHGVACMPRRVTSPSPLRIASRVSSPSPIPSYIIQYKSDNALE